MQLKCLTSVLWSLEKHLLFETVQPHFPTHYGSVDANVTAFHLHGHRTECSMQTFKKLIWVGWLTYSKIKDWSKASQSVFFSETSLDLEDFSPFGLYHR